MRLRIPRASEMSRLLGGLGLLICLAEFYRLGISSYRMKVIAINSYQVANIGPLMVTDMHWLVFGSAFVLYTAVQGFLTTSRVGRTVQAFLDGRSATIEAEVQEGSLRLWVCGLGAVLGGMGGGLAGLYLNDVYPTMGIAITYKTLAIMLIGTLGGLHGVILAAFALALIEGLVLPILYRPLLSDVILLVALAVASCFSHRVTTDCR
jgi:branched-chain amino acid transport system permease protein